MKHEIPRDEGHPELLSAFTYLERENLWSGAGHISTTVDHSSLLLVKSVNMGVLPWDTEELSTCSLG